jgi:hypothetical protein
MPFAASSTRRFILCATSLATVYSRRNLRNPGEIYPLIHRVSFVQITTLTSRKR